MKANAQLQQFKKCLILFTVGITCSALAYAIYVINPIKVIVEQKLRMAPGTLVFSLWEKPPVDIYIKVYIFNITNPNEFIAGTEKLRVEEIGPYVYQEMLENHNITWNPNGTVSYRPKRLVYFVPEMSVGDPKDAILRVPNVPLLGVASALHDSSSFVTVPLSGFIELLDSQTILNITAYDYLWGYDDTLVHLASNLVPNFVNFRKFGLMDRLYDEGNNLMTMNIKKNENMTDEDGRYLSIETLNGNPGLSNWGWVQTEANETNPLNTKCNRLRGSTEGTLFPPNLDKHAVFRVFRKAFCRTLPINFVKEVTTESGLPGYMYNFVENFLDPPDVNPDNECYCREKKKCLKMGLSDMTPCYYNVPAAMSMPHFYKADPSLLEAVDGLKPDEERHDTRIILQPTVGIPLHVNSRMQTNLVMENVQWSERIKPFNDLTIPLIWTDLFIPELPSDLILLLRLGLQIGPVVQTVVISILGVIGVTTFIFSLLKTVWIVHQQAEEDSKSEDSNDLKISLGYGQYSSIRILPAIKKITSRTDLFARG
ncbi:scavenger receptor class B member 1 [Neodiprion virginianus]|uniref:scavenger receptor class B member 1 n=1 Tax=Neodiprion virginianus TaxID=2961670 RepID=UPI001EE70284|nr:scavenger receptor class B member 1 [Neodiprion virginianus]XP_046615005.1 scavenger receptor class B member 1 [Neodiprion virginianus]